MSNWNISMTSTFREDLRKLDDSLWRRADGIVDRMTKNPFNDDLGWEKLSRTESGLYSTRVNEEYRIIWKHIKPRDIVFCLADQHDHAYMRARRLSFRKVDNEIKIVDIMETEATSFEARAELFTPQSQMGHNIGGLFIAYTDPQIREWGIPEEYFPNIRALDNANQLGAFEGILEESVYNTLLVIALDIVERPVVPDSELTASLIENNGGQNIYRFEDDEEFKRVLRGSLEEWMLFLAYDQRSIIHREYNGPARIKGVAGSGKTVIAIHRARHLAKIAEQNGQKVLFLTFGNRLPKIIRYLFSQLVGEGSNLLNHIEFRTIHSWCTKFLSMNDIYLLIKMGKARGLLSDAISCASRAHMLSRNLEKRGQSFFEEEIRYTIKGKALASEEEYLALERSGRGTRLAEEDRRAVWKIYQEYQRSMKAANCSDYDDLICFALDLIKEGKPLKKYQSVVVDEIQDLTEATMRLIRALVPQGSDDIFLVGDGLQKIYPGGYSLNKVGIDITGRGRILRKNYRNTQQILQAAHSMMEGVDYDDTDDDGEQDEVPEYSLRQGKLPFLGRFSSIKQELFWIKSEIERLISEGCYVEKDFALIYRWAENYKSEITNIIANGRQVIEIGNDAESYFGPGIKLTTFHSAKGLEFKVVFVVGVTDCFEVPRDDLTLMDEELEDYLAREKRLLYVAMTRARDLVYLTCARGQPSRFLNAIPDRMLEKKNL